MTECNAKEFSLTQDGEADMNRHLHDEFRRTVKFFQRLEAVVEHLPESYPSNFGFELFRKLRYMKLAYEGKHGSGYVWLVDGEDMARISGHFDNGDDIVCVVPVEQIREALKPILGD